MNTNNPETQVVNLFRDLVREIADRISQKEARSRSYRDWRDAHEQLTVSSGCAPMHSHLKEHAYRLYLERKDADARSDWFAAERTVLKAFWGIEVTF